MKVIIDLGWKGQIYKVQHFKPEAPENNDLKKNPNKFQTGNHFDLTAPGSMHTVTDG